MRSGARRTAKRPKLRFGPHLQSVVVSGTARRTFESSDDTGQNPRLVGGGAQRATLRDAVVPFSRQERGPGGVERWVFHGEVSPRDVPDFHHESHRAATRLPDGEPLPSYSFTKKGVSVTRGTLILTLHPPAADAGVVPGTP